MLEATQLRKDMKAVRADATGLSKLIEKDPAWDWALNEKNKGVLDDAEKNLSDKLTLFHVSWLNDNPRQVQSRFEPEIVVTELKSFNKLKGECTALQKICEQFRARRGAGMKPKKESVTPKKGKN